MRMRTANRVIDIAQHIIKVATYAKNPDRPKGKQITRSRNEVVIGGATQILLTVMKDAKK